MDRKHLYLLALILCAVGLGTVWFKAVFLGVPLVPDRSTPHWEVETRISFSAKGGPAKVTLVLPTRDPRWLTLDESFVSRGFGLTTGRVDKQRVAVWSLRNAEGGQTLYYKGKFLSDLSPDPSPGEVSNTPLEPPKARKLDWPAILRTAGEGFLAPIKATSADIPTLVPGILAGLRAGATGENAKLLLGKTPTERKVMEVAVDLLALMNIPARAVHGFKMEAEQVRAKIEHRLEVWSGKGWQRFDLFAADPEPPEKFMAWWFGADPMASVSGGSKPEVTISITKSSEVALAAQIAADRKSGSALLRFSALGLPLDTQLVYRVILMVPLGAFLIVLVRNVIGFKTLGTFMPVLIALAFREVNLFQGVVLFILVVLAGLAVRSYLEKLKLLLVPRLASVIIVVVLLMLALSVVSHQLGIQAGLSVGLFPMVILTMTIERLSVVWDERGAGEAFQQGGGSLVTALGAYFLMNIERLKYLVFTFPELLLVLLAATLLLGRYSGYRLTELRRFRVLTEDGK